MICWSYKSNIRVQCTSKEFVGDDRASGGARHVSALPCLQPLHGADHWAAVVGQGWRKSDLRCRISEPVFFITFWQVPSPSDRSTQPLWSLKRGLRGWLLWTNPTSWGCVHTRGNDGKNLGFPVFLNTYMNTWTILLLYSPRNKSRAPQTEATSFQMVPI